MKENKYQFKKGDFVICKPPEEKRSEGNKDFEIYAYVVEVDRKNDILRLERYLKQGKLHMEQSPKFHLAEMEKDGFYQPMNYDEIKEFYDGVASLLASAKFQNNLYTNDVRWTFEALEAAVEDICRKTI